MSRTKIEWAKDSWNPMTGCTPVSEGCKNCYAKRLAEGRLRGRCGYAQDDPFAVTLRPERLKQPIRWRKSSRIFVCSMGDLFHEDVPDYYLDRIMSIINLCNKHTFIILTKRPERLANNMVIPNLILGVSVENQTTAYERIPILLDTPAATRIVSFEPLLRLVRVAPVILAELDGVIVGAETGPGKRPMDIEWARSIRDQCKDAGVPFFFKKDSSGKRELDGVIHDEFPEVKP